MENEIQIFKFSTLFSLVEFINNIFLEIYEENVLQTASIKKLRLYRPVFSGPSGVLIMMGLVLYSLNLSLSLTFLVFIIVTILFIYFFQPAYSLIHLTEI